MVRTQSLPELAWLFALLLALILALLLGCRGPGLGALRSATYPPDFQYLQRTELRSTMSALAREIRGLEDWTHAARERDPVDLTPVVLRLERMSDLTQGLERGQRSNRTRVHSGIDDLERAVSRALDAARREPPRFDGPEPIAAACIRCHRR